MLRLMEAPAHLQRNLGAASLTGLGLLWYSTGPPRGDFANYWTAATLWAEGADLTHLYDYRWFTEQAARMGFDDQLVGFPVLTPPSALLAVPLLPLGLKLALQTWWVMQGLLALLLAWVLARSMNRPLWQGVTLLLAFAPAIHSHLVQGQAHLPALVLLAGGTWAWMRQRDGLAGGAWGLAIGLKVMAWPLLGLAVVARRWRVLTTALVTLSLGAGCSVALLGWEIHVQYFLEIGPAATRGMYADPWHLGFGALPQALRVAMVPHPGLNPDPGLSLPVLAQSIPRALTVLLVGLTLAVALPWSTSTHNQRLRVLAAAVLASTVSGPMLATYHLSWWVPVAAWSGKALWADGHRMRAVSTVGLLAAACWVPLPEREGLTALLAIPRFWLGLGSWFLLLPWIRIRRGRGAQGAACVVVASGLVLATHSEDSQVSDGAESVDGPSFPLVSSDLTRTADGRLWWSGLTPNRKGHEGSGWVGFTLDPVLQEAVLTASDSTRHTWSPHDNGSGSVAWRVGAGHWTQSPEVKGPAGGTLVSRRIDGQTDVYWLSGSGQSIQLTRNPAQDSWPAWNPDEGYIYFLSDRDSGVRALRLWRLRWADHSPAVDLP
ncbi:MAG: glycosyltransferase 87 family protein, partial [Myxococcota bacterium]|nr:glycosyltransferase 87 family protein [Myxococcota bacterium]